MSESPLGESPRWSDGGRAAFVEAAETAIEAYRRYIELVASSTTDTDHDRIDAAKRPVARAFLEAHQAELVHAGTLGPFWSPPHPVVEDERPSIGGQQMVTVIERHDYVLVDADADAVRGAVEFDAVVEGRPVEHAELRSPTELLGDVLTTVAIRGSSTAVEALPGVEYGAGLAVAFAHDRPIPYDWELNDELDHGTAFAVEGVLVGATTVG